MFRIQADSKKGGKARILPMAPEFAEFIDQTPSDERDGFVFNPMPRRQQSTRLLLDAVSKTICGFGKAAAVKVSESKAGKAKYASAHDIRRAFGLRWSKRVMPPILQQMMRHESIETTMRFYVGRNAEDAADEIWRSFSVTSSDTNTVSQSEEQPETKKALLK